MSDFNLSVSVDNMGKIRVTYPVDEVCLETKTISADAARRLASELVKAANEVLAMRTRR